MAAYDAFYRRLIAAAPLKNVSSRFAMEHVKRRHAVAHRRGLETRGTARAKLGAVCGGSDARAAGTARAPGQRGKRADSRRPSLRVGEVGGGITARRLRALGRRQAAGFPCPRPCPIPSPCSALPSPFRARARAPACPPASRGRIPPPPRTCRGSSPPSHSRDAASAAGSAPARSGSSGGSGSSSYTSRAAPAISPRSRAAISAARSTIGPREVFTRMALRLHQREFGLPPQGRACAPTAQGGW